MKKTKKYEPFGEEWVKEVSKFPKSFLVDQWRQSRLEVQQLRSTLKECPHCQISPVGVNAVGRRYNEAQIEIQAVLDSVSSNAEVSL